MSEQLTDARRKRTNRLVILAKAKVAVIFGKGNYFIYFNKTISTTICLIHKSVLYLYCQNNRDN